MGDEVLANNALTYNFAVADFETYYVSRERVLVHNCPEVDEVAKEAADAAKRLGVNLDKISVTNGVDRTKIVLSSNLDTGDINKLKDVFK